MVRLSETIRKQNVDSFRSKTYHRSNKTHFHHKMKDKIHPCKTKNNHSQHSISISVHDKDPVGFLSFLRVSLHFLLHFLTFILASFLYTLFVNQALKTFVRSKLTSFPEWIVFWLNLHQLHRLYHHSHVIVTK